MTTTTCAVLMFCVIDHPIANGIELCVKLSAIMVSYS